MRGLADRDAWEAGYDRVRGGVPIGRGHHRRRWTRSHLDHLLFEVHYQRYLGDLAGKRLVELGSAPGRHLVELRDRFGIEPYGVELTTAGTELNRRVFSDAGIDPARVVQADFLSDEFQRSWAETFDVVISRGVIEHFPDPRRAVAAHLGPLAPGGLLLVMIPNVRGVYELWLERFHPALLARHNLDVMRPTAFREACRHDGLECLHCGLLGVFDTYSLRVDPTRSRTLPRFVELLRRLLLPLQPALRILAPHGGLESQTLSPFLLFVGRKTR